jgi:hypothetical protein
MIPGKGGAGMPDFKLSNRHKLFAIGLLLLVNGIINLVFFQQRTEHLNHYTDATLQLQLTEKKYQESLLLLEQKQDRLERKIQGLDSLVALKKTKLQPIRKQVLIHTGADWNKLTEKERKAYTDKAIHQILQSKVK